MLVQISTRLINIYQKYCKDILLSACRFSPSCSEYAKQALLKYGFFIGMFKTARRLLLCHPFSGKEGYDPLL